MNGAAPPFASASRPKQPSAMVLVAAATLLVLHFIMAVGSKWHESTTSDELVHLTAGTSYWQNDDYRLQPENGVLPQRWAALPAWLQGAKFPPLAGNPNWRDSDVWALGYQFFYETGEDHFPRLMAGRAMIALFSVATGLLVFWWSFSLFGAAGGLVSLTLYAFCPTFLAHGALVTSGVCMAFFFLAAAGAWWWQLHDARARVWWLSSLTVGLAFVAKYSAVLLPPMMVLMAVVRAFAPEPLTLGRWTFSTRPGKFGAAALSAAGHALVAALVIWACYGFRYSAFNPSLPPADHFIRPWEFMESRIGLAGQVIHVLAGWHALPEAFLYGLAYVINSAATRAAFLNGEYSITGWRMFFPWAFVLKTTVPALLAFVLTAGLAARRWAGRADWRHDLYRVTPLVVLFGVYWLSSLASNLNIGQRHLLPTYPALFIGTGALGSWIISRQFGRVTVVAALIGWHIFASVQVAPHYLAYFNRLAGGPENGWRHLVDSSLDWGQDLPGLEAWLKANAGQERVFLSYFGTGEPDYYGIRATRMPFVNLFARTNPWYEPQAGLYCVGATMLQHVYSPFRGDWRAEWEKEYQEGRAKEPLFREYWRNPAVRNDLVRLGAAAAFEETWRRYDQLRFARLCYYLRVRTPDAAIGHSILIYRLNEAEVSAALNGTLADWRGLIEHTVTSRP